MMFHPQVCACIHHLHVPSLLPWPPRSLRKQLFMAGQPPVLHLHQSLGQGWQLSVQLTDCSSPQLSLSSLHLSLAHLFFSFFFSLCLCRQSYPSFLAFPSHTLCCLCQTSVRMFWSQWCLEGDTGLTLPAPSMSRGSGRAELINRCLIMEGSSHSLPALPPGCWWGRAQLGEHEARPAAESWACCAACPRGLLLPPGVASPIPCCRVGKSARPSCSLCMENWAG